MQAWMTTGSTTAMVENASPAADGFSWALGLVTKVQTGATTAGTTVVVKPLHARHLHLYLLSYMYVYI